MILLLLPLLLLLTLSGCGNERSAEQLLDSAVGALGEGRLREADALAEKVVAQGGPRLAALGVFLRGNVKFAQCERAARQADTPQAEPFAFDVAIRYGDQAREFWQRVAVTRSDWPEARRNVERALLRLEDLRRKKAEAERRRRADRQPRRLPLPLPQPQAQAPDAPREEPPEEAALRLQENELSPEQVARLMERLAAREREKRELRWRQRRRLAGEVEHGW